MTEKEEKLQAWLKLVPEQSRARILESLQKSSNMTAEERLKYQVDTYNKQEKPLDTETGIDCPICHNKRDIAFIKDEVEYHRPCECTQAVRSIRELKRSGLTNLTGYTFEKFNAAEDWQKNIKSKALEFVTEPCGKWFFIGGQSGAGKTHICTAMTVELIKNRLMAAKYMMWRDTVSRLNSIANDVTYLTEINPYKEAPVLYIDDLFKTKKGGNISQGEINRAFGIINARYSNPDSITIISSEFTLPELNTIDEATASRIAERAGNYFVNIGKDRSRNQRLK